MPTSTIGIRTRSKPGFTLLELMVALVIMIVMSGVVMASMWPAMSEARLRSGTSMAIGALRYARSYAVTHRTRTAVEFEFNAEKQGVSVLIPETDESGEESWRVLTTQAGQYRSLPEGIVIAGIERPQTGGSMEPSAAADDGRETVTFSALGQAEDVRIILEDPREDRPEDERNYQRIIQVDAITGRCELVDDEL
ncbi:MAG: GspH/FimT family pseudopilin [Armatimonadota bacterium]